MRILIIEPSNLKQESLKRLQDVGWGLCRVPSLKILKVFDSDRSPRCQDVVCANWQASQDGVCACMHPPVCVGYYSKNIKIELMPAYQHEQAIRPAYQHEQAIRPA